MSDDSPQMKPQDTVIYILGELKGQVSGVQTSITANTQAQAQVNAENHTEHEEFRKALGKHGDEITGIKSTLPLRVSPWSKLGVIIAVLAAATALAGFIITYLQH